MANINFDFIKKMKADAEFYAPPTDTKKKTIISLILTVFIGAVQFYAMVPALNFKSSEFYMFIFSLLVAFIVINIVLSKAFTAPEYLPYINKNSKIVAIIAGVLVIVIAVGGLSGAALFRAKSYSKLMPVQDGDFKADVSEIDFSSVPTLDANSAKKIAERTLGDLSDYVSQFEVSDSATQINLKEVPTRVFPLKYGDFFKWMRNTKNGIPAYISVDTTTQEGKIERLESGIKYSPAELFNRNLIRYLRFRHPTLMFGTPNFEVNEEKTPYYIVPVLDKTIGLFGGRDSVGAVVLNAQTGEESLIYTTERGKKLLKTDKSVNDKDFLWIDKVYESSLLTEQYNYFGKLNGGFWNSLIGQKNVSVTSQGYNYLALNDDVYMYTGVTSISSDQSIIGFVLINQRTKEAKFYRISGALESQAMTSAQGAVQQYSYNATFPLLLNISGEPTYFVALKDSSELVKMYAMVNVKQSTVVGFGTSLTECTEKYASELKKNGISVDINVNKLGAENDPTKQGGEKQTEVLTVSGKVVEIRSASLAGDTYYFVKLEGQDKFFKLKASENEKAVLMNTGENISVTLSKTENDKTIIDGKLN